MGGLGAALADLVPERHHPVHGADGGQVDAVVEQDGIHLGRGLVREPLLSSTASSAACSAPVSAAGCGARGPGGAFLRGRFRIALAVQRRP